MSNSYLNGVNSVFEHLPPVTPENFLELSKYQMENVFSWRSEKKLDQIPTQAGDDLGVQDLSTEDQAVYHSRVVGGMATRIALGSLYANAQSPSFTVFSELSHGDQVDILDQSIGMYSSQLSRRLGVGSVAQTLKPDDATYAEMSASDPVKVPSEFVRKQLYDYKTRQLTRRDRMSRVLHYANVRVGSFPGSNLYDRSVGTNDSLLVQAFGRNTITDEELPELRRAYDVDAERNDMLMWEILKASKFDPGSSNEALAEAVATKLTESPVIEPILQWEDGYALWQKNPDLYARNFNRIHTVWPQSQVYRTFEVKRDSLDIMDRFGLYNPLELSHPDMMIRALSILSKLGVEADPLIVEVPFDADSVQRQVTGPREWQVREALTRVHHVLHRHIKF